MKIATILPYKENYTSSKAAAASLWVSDFFKNSRLKKNNFIYGSTDTTDYLTNNYINIKMKGEQLRAILSVVVLACGLKFGYDLFQQKIIPAVNITNLKGPIELNSFSQGLINISNQNPEIYAIFSITVAIVLGIIVAYSFKKLF